MTGKTFFGCECSHLGAFTYTVNAFGIITVTCPRCRSSYTLPPGMTVVDDDAVPFLVEAHGVELTDCSAEGAAVGLRILGGSAEIVRGAVINASTAIEVADGAKVHIDGFFHDVGTAAGEEHHRPG